MKCNCIILLYNSFELFPRKDLAFLSLIIFGTLNNVLWDYHKVMMIMTMTMTVMTTMTTMTTMTLMMTWSMWSIQLKPRQSRPTTKVLKGSWPRNYWLLRLMMIIIIDDDDEVKFLKGSQKPTITSLRKRFILFHELFPMVLFGHFPYEKNARMEMWFFVNFYHVTCIFLKSFQRYTSNFWSQMHLVYYLNDSELIGKRFENLFVFGYTLLGLPK